MAHDPRAAQALEIRPPNDEDWTAIAELITRAVPNALASKLGRRFGALYYQGVARHPHACIYAACDPNGRLAGVILGSLDRRASRALAPARIGRLLLAANIRLCSPAVMRWVWSGLRYWRSSQPSPRQRPQAELMVIVVHEDFQGQRLAGRLIAALEQCFRQHDLRGPYLILTEQSNLVANGLYEKIGARFIRTYAYHDKTMNEWHKNLEPPAPS